MSDVGLEPSEAWQHGNQAGSDDAAAFLDWRSAVRNGEARRGRPRTTPNPYPRLTLEHDDWAAAYQHGWGEEIDRDNQRTYRLRQKGLE